MLKTQTGREFRSSASCKTNPSVHKRPKSVQHSCLFGFHTTSFSCSVRLPVVNLPEETQSSPAHHLTSNSKCLQSDPAFLAMDRLSLAIAKHSAVADPPRSTHLFQLDVNAVHSKEITNITKSKVEEDSPPSQRRGCPSSLENWPVIGMHAQKIIHSIFKLWSFDFLLYSHIENPLPSFQS
jgi:hypothetical protein